jgi:PPM family protein phosphatase
VTARAADQVLTSRVRADTFRETVHQETASVLRAHGITDKGRVRPVNEDCWAFEPSCGLCVVADGMGGHRAGEVAARIAVDTIVASVKSSAAGVEWPFGFDPSLSTSGNRLRTAIQLAHMHILETAVTSDQYAGMGTTIVAAMMDGDRLSVAHAGDSRLYLLEGARLRLLTHDDSWMASMLAQDPSADRGRYERHPMRNALTNVVGARQRAEVHVIEETLSGGELLVLTTDGVHGVLDDERLEELLLDGCDEEKLARKLVAAALTRGSHDNCTALVARYLRD